MNGLIHQVIHFLLNINAAVIYIFYDLCIYIMNGFEHVFMGRRLGLGMCWDYAYVNINHMAP